MFLDLTVESGYCKAHLLKPLATPNLSDGVKVRVLAKLDQSPLATPQPSPAKGFLSHKDAKDFMHTQGVNQREWAIWAKSNKPSDIPQNPSTYYKGHGWRSWNHFLGAHNNDKPHTFGSISRRGSLKRSSDQLVASAASPLFKIRFTEPSDEDAPIVAEFIQPASSFHEAEEVRSETLTFKKFEKSSLSFVQCFDPLSSYVIESNQEADEVLTELEALQASLKQTEEKNRASAVVIYKRVVDESALLPPCARTRTNTVQKATLKK